MRLLAVLILALAMGCGGGGGSNTPADSNRSATVPFPKPSAVPTVPSLAKFLPGKRISVVAPAAEGEPGASPAPEGPALEEDLSQHMLLQFEANGTLRVGAYNEAGQAEALPRPGLTYTVTGLQVTVYDRGKIDGGVTFPRSTPAKGDALVVIEKTPRGQMKTQTTITAIAPAAPMGVLRLDDNATAPKPQ